MSSSSSVLFLLFAPLAIAQVPRRLATESRRTLAGFERDYFITVPSSPPTAILLNIHGFSSSCETFKDWSGFQGAAEEHGWLVVTPCGQRGFLGNGYAWNAGTCCTFPDAEDDVAFLGGVISEVQESDGGELPVWAVGHSNGAAMAGSLACHGMVSKVSMMSAPFFLNPGYPKNMEVCDNLYPSSNPLELMLANHGTLDDTVPYKGGVLAFAPREEDIRRWALRMGVSLAEAGSIPDSPVSIREWTNEGGKAIRFYLEKGGTHSVPRNKISGYDMAKITIELFANSQSLPISGPYNGPALPSSFPFSTTASPSTNLSNDVEGSTPSPSGAGRSEAYLVVLIVAFFGISFRV